MMNLKQRPVRDFTDKFAKKALSAEFAKKLGAVNSENYWAASHGVFRIVDAAPEREPDYVSGQGDWQSLYWYTPEGLYRRSQHWGHVAQCYWGTYVSEDGPEDGPVVLPTDPCKCREWVTAFVPWASLKWAFDTPTEESLNQKVKDFSAILAGEKEPTHLCMTKTWLTNQVNKAKAFLALYEAARKKL